MSVEEWVADGERHVKLTSPVYQRFVALENDCSAPFSDNFFDVLPGESVVVRQKDCAARAPVHVRALADLCRVGRFKTLSAKIKVFLSARNIANALYHSRVPRDGEGQ